MRAPPVDTRGYADLVDETEALAQRLSGWRPPPDGQADAGRALIRVFGRFAELVVDRINRAPDKSYLAFLNLLGAAPLPPLPARVPLTFTLAEGSPVDTTVPAGTQVAAPPLEGEEDEVTFETEERLVVTRAQLRAVVVGDPRTDAWADRAAPATGSVDEPFAAFGADEPIPHHLYVACDPLLTRPGPHEVTLTLRSPDTWQWTHWPVTWSSWDGAAWQPLTAGQTVGGGAWRVTLHDVPQLTPHAVGGVEAGWLRARLELPLPPGETAQVPDRVAVGARIPQPAAFPLAPFPATGTSRFFYLSADGPFGAAGARARLRVQLARPGAATGVRLNWSYPAGDRWLPLGQSGSADGQEHLGGDFELRDTTLALTRDGEVSFQVPLEWPRKLLWNQSGRWLRVDLASGEYGTPPEVASLTVDHDWELPRLGGITVTARQAEPPAPELPPGAYHNATPLDPSKDFYPFGTLPVFNDTFYVACPEALAWPGATVTLRVTLTNPAGGTGAPVPPVDPEEGNHPEIAWEVSDGTRWHRTAATYDFTTSGEFTVTLPDQAAPGTVNGEEGRWLRARLAGGGYGRLAASTPNGDGTYQFTPPAVAPPVVRTLTFTPAGAQQAGVSAPPSACLAGNDFAHTDHTAAAQAGEFVPFTTASDREPALYLGFDRPFDSRPVTLHLQVEPPRPEEVAAEALAGIDPAAAAQVVWEYAGPDGWRPLGVRDGTLGLSRRGQVSFVGPRDLAARSRFGQERYWLRARWRRGAFPLPPRLRRVLPNTVWAVQARAVSDEILGSSNAEADQAFTTASTPVLPGQRVVVREPDGGWTHWQAVPDFHGSGPRDRHYTIDPPTGTIRFGDGVHGMVPPPSPNNVRATYRTGGGARGNRAAGTVAELKSGVPYIDAVTNHEPAQGGAQGEPVERVAERGPRVLRHRDRAVTAQDLENLAADASGEVARVVAVAPTFNPYDLWLDPEAAPTAGHAGADAGRMGVVVVPDADAARPTPSLALLRTVLAHLEARCPATAELWVAGPEWIAVTVTATVVASSPEAAGTLGDRVRATLERFLHPLTGGSSGDGWAFGRKPHRSDLTAVIEAVGGVDHVRALTAELRPETGDPERRVELEALLNRPLADLRRRTELAERDHRRWLGRSLVYSGRHAVEVVLDPDGP